MLFELISRGWLGRELQHLCAHGMAVCGIVSAATLFDQPGQPAGIFNAKVHARHPLGNECGRHRRQKHIALLIGFDLPVTDAEFRLPSTLRGLLHRAARGSLCRGGLKQSGQSLRAWDEGHDIVFVNGCNRLIQGRASHRVPHRRGQACSSLHRESRGQGFSDN
jgi:hypothetical protein